MDMILKVYDYIINYCEVVGFLSHYYHNYIDDDNDDDYDDDSDVDLLYDDDGDMDVDVNDNYACGITFGSWLILMRGKLA